MKELPVREVFGPNERIGLNGESYSVKVVG